MNNISDFMNVDNFIQLVVEKLSQDDSNDRRLCDYKWNVISIEHYYTQDQIIEAIRSILSPTKAKDETRRCL